MQLRRFFDVSAHNSGLKATISAGFTCPFLFIFTRLSSSLAMLELQSSSWRHSYPNVFGKVSNVFSDHVTQSKCLITERRFWEISQRNTGRLDLLTGQIKDGPWIFLKETIFFEIMSLIVSRIMPEESCLTKHVFEFSARTLDSFAMMKIIRTTRIVRSNLSVHSW